MPWGNLPAEPIGSLPRLRSSLVGAHLKANYVLPFSQLALRELSLGSSGLLWPEDRSIKPNTLCLQRGTDRWSRQMVYTGGLDRWFGQVVVECPIVSGSKRAGCTVEKW